MNGLLKGAFSLLARNPSMTAIVDDVGIMGFKAFAGRKGTTVAKHMFNTIGIPLVFGVLTTPKEQRLKTVASTLSIGALTLGMSPSKMMMAQLSLTAAPHLGDGVRLIAHSQRGALEARTMAAVPFSYSSQSMDFVNSQYQQSRQVIDSQYAFLGNEAAFMAARYLNK
jgi:hypothetical protein